MSLPVAVFASGSGSNLQAILDHHAGLRTPSWHVGLVVADRDGIHALDRARRAGIKARVIPVSGRAQAHVAEETLEALLSAKVGFVALAGYLRLIPAAVTVAFQGRMVNIHPALLPAFGGPGMYGMRVHEAVLCAGVRVTGVTVHFVDEVYDRGPILAQWPVPVLQGDTSRSVAARVLRIEHLLYPRIVEHMARALSENRSPVPFFLPGDHFTAGAGPSGDIERTIEESFWRIRKHLPSPVERASPVEHASR